MKVAERRAAKEEIPEWKVAAIERRRQEAATAVEVKKQNAERTQAAAEWAVAEAQAKAVIAAVGEAPQGSVNYEDIVKFHEATSILMGGPEEAARRAVFKAAAISRFDQKAAEDTLQEVKRRHDEEEQEHKANLARADNWLKQRAASKKTSKEKRNKF